MTVGWCSYVTDEKYMLLAAMTFVSEVGCPPNGCCLHRLCTVLVPYAVV
jgi:hypothetical protein